MAYILLMILSGTAIGGTAIVCHPEGTCDLIITQDN